eukprot:g2157.t1
MSTTTTRPKRFVNEKKSIVQEAIDGLVSTHSNVLSRLDGYPNTKVVVRTDWDKSKVAIVTGGGSGHEPAHAGFVGKGMLTAAVCGEIFASPTVDAVLSAILAVTGKAGCLVIVKNYTGDRLNFGLACEKAKTEYGLDVRMVICADDVALGATPKARGIAGTLFLHKLAGAAAESGATLNEVWTLASRVATHVKSMGASFSTCTQPFAGTSRSLGDDAMELGLGIHGEPGMKTSSVLSSRDTIDAVTQEVWSHLDLAAAMTKKNLRLIVLVNNLGGVPALEMSIVAKDVLESVEKLAKSKNIAADVHLVGPARLMTALNMNGVSVSILPITSDEDFNLLVAPAAPHTSWPYVSRAPTTLVTKFVKDPLGNAATKVGDGKMSDEARDAAMEAKIETVCRGLISIESTLNALDAVVGDGDTGTQMSVGARSVLEALSKKTIPSKDCAATCVALSKVLFRNMGGSSGVLLSILFQKMGGALSSEDSDFGLAFRSGLEAMMEYGGASEGDRTMLDALLPASRAKTLQDAATAAMKGAEATKTMCKANAGRSMYVGSSNLEGNMDPGAYAAAFALKNLSEA